MTTRIRLPVIFVSTPATSGAAAPGRPARMRRGALAIGVDRDQPLHEASDGLFAPDHPSVALPSPSNRIGRSRPCLAQKPTEGRAAQLSPNLLAGARPDDATAPRSSPLSRRGLRASRPRSGASAVKTLNAGR